MRQAGEGELGAGGGSVRQNPGRENPCQRNCAGDPIPRRDPRPPPRLLLVSPALPHAWRKPPDLPAFRGPTPLPTSDGSTLFEPLRFPKPSGRGRPPAVFHDSSNANWIPGGSKRMV